MKNASSTYFWVFVAVIFLQAHSVPSEAVEIRRGDILVADPDFVHVGWDGQNPTIETMQPTLWKIDPDTGVREVITSKHIGEGASLLSIVGVVVDRAGRMTIADTYSAALMRVDPATGDRSYFSTSNDGNGAPMNSVSALAVDRDDSLVVLDYYEKNIVRIDPLTGHRTLISGPTRGEGPLFPYISTISLDHNGNIWTSVYNDSTQSALVRIDPNTGDRIIVSGFGMGDGPLLFSDLHDILNFDADSVIVTTQNQLFHIDLTNGNRSVIETDGPWVNWLHIVAKADDNTLYLGDEYDGNVHRLDLTTGDYHLLSGNTPEWGPRMWMPQDMFVVVPEPNSAICLIAFLSLFAATSRR
jgi:sugar lactone lactonase YvrE